MSIVLQRETKTQRGDMTCPCRMEVGFQLALVAIGLAFLPRPRCLPEASEGAGEMMDATETHSEKTPGHSERSVIPVSF